MSDIPFLLSHLGSTKGPIATAVLLASLIVPLLMSQVFGILGLVIFNLASFLIVRALFPNELGDCLVALSSVAWCVVRWRLIRVDVRRYWLDQSRYKALTWIWHFCIFGFGMPAPERSSTASHTGTASDGGSFGDTWGDGGDGSGDCGGGGDGGGGDGGGGDGGGGGD